MTEGEAVPLLARWIAELQTDMADQRNQIRQLEHRVLRLEQHIRRQAEARRHWMTNGHKARL